MAALNKKEKLAKDFIPVAFMEHEGDWMNTADRLLNAYHGKYHVRASRRDRFVVNTIFSLVNLIMPSLMFSNPYWRAIPLNAKYSKKIGNGQYQVVDSNKAAMVREATINHKYRQINAFEEHVKAVRDALFFAFGITKVGYSFETMREEDYEIPIKDTPTLQRVNPRHFGWHPLATTLKDSELLVHRFQYKKEQLEELDWVKKNELKNLSAEVPEFIKKRFPNADKLKGEGRITLHEVYNQDEDVFYLFGDNGGCFLGKHDNGYLHNKSIYNKIEFASDNDSFIGVALLSTIENEAQILNELITRAVTHLRKYPAMTFYEPGGLTDLQIETIENGQQGSLNMVQDVKKLLTTNPLQMGSDYLNMVSLIQGLIDRVIGTTSFTRLAPATRKSAQEASYIQGDVSVQTNWYLSTIKDFLVRDIHKIADIQAQFQDEKEEIMASGDLGGMPIKYNKEDIQGDWDFTFDVDSLQATNTAQFNNITTLLTALASNPVFHPMLRTLDPRKAAKKLFKTIDMNLDSLERGEIADRVEYTPERENQMARANQPMPKPKWGEDYDYHLGLHADDLEKGGPNEQILDHIAETMMLKQGHHSGQDPYAPQQGAAPQEGAPQGPQTTEVPAEGQAPIGPDIAR